MLIAFLIFVSAIIAVNPKTFFMNYNALRIKKKIPLSYFGHGLSYFHNYLGTYTCAERNPTASVLWKTCNSNSCLLCRENSASILVVEKGREKPFKS